MGGNNCPTNWSLASITRSRLILEGFIFYSKVINLITVLRNCLYFHIQLREFDNLICLGTLLESREERKWAYFLNISPTFSQLPGKFFKDTKIHLKMSFIYAGMNILEMQRFYFNLKCSSFKLEASCRSKEGHI